MRFGWIFIEKESRRKERCHLVLSAKTEPQFTEFDGFP